MNNAKPLTFRDVLYEKPGPKTRRLINIVTVITVIVIILLIILGAKRFYESGQLDARYWSFFLKLSTWKFIGSGLLGTIEAAALGGIIGFAAGFTVMLGRVSKFKLFNLLSRIYTEFTRGVPTLLFIYFFFLVVPQMGFKLAAIWKISLPVAISASGMIAEVLRSGVNAVSKGQWEAAYSLGMRESKVFSKIIFPQGFRFVIPALIAELVIVVKDTTFAYIVNFPDLMQNAKVLISNHSAMLSVYIVVSVIYIVINYLLNKLSVYAAERLDVKLKPAQIEKEEQ